MVKGFTYTGTAKDGTKLHRYSARHLSPIYTHAAVNRNATGNGSFHSTLAGARSESTRWKGRAPAEIVELVATPGKLKKGDR